MWTSQTSTHYVSEAEPCVPDEYAFPAALVTPTTSYENVKISKCLVQYTYTNTYTNTSDSWSGCIGASNTIKSLKK